MRFLWSRVEFEAAVGSNVRSVPYGNDDENKWETYLDLNTAGCDLTVPGPLVPPTSKAVIIEPEKHFSFSTVPRRDHTRLG